jgi:NitT/TauT family transport system substrate-binding protein
MPSNDSQNRPRYRRLAKAGLAIAAGALILSGCAANAAPAATTGTGGKLTALHVRTSFSFNPSNENVFLAISKGYFADEGLDVDLKEGNGSSAVLQLMSGSGDTDIGVTIDAGTAALSISKGVPAKIAQLGTAVAPFGTICYKSADVKSGKDLKGKTAIVVPSESTAAVLPAYLAQLGLKSSDLTLVAADFSNKQSLFLSGKADCMLGYTSSELVQAEMQLPDKLGKPMSWANDGFKLLGDATVVSQKLSKQPKLVEAFLRAYDKGTAYMCANQKKAADAYNQRDSTFTATDKAYSPIAIKAYCDDLTSGGSKPFAGISDAGWSTAMKTLASYDGLSPVLPRTDYFMKVGAVPAVSW